MNEAWQRAVEAALIDQSESSSSAGASPEPRSLTLDGAVKCLHGRLPSPEILERYQTLERLSIANIGVSSLENFPRLKNLQRLSLSDNRIAGGLEFLVEAGLNSLRDLDLSNNRIQFLEDLEPLARLRLVSLDLYECPVTRIKDYRARVFGMMRGLKYLDKLDVNGNERLESDDEDDDEDEEEDEEMDEEDPGSGEVDGGDRAGKLANGAGHEGRDVGVFDEDEESDADEETDVEGRLQANGDGLDNRFQVEATGARVVDVEGDQDEEEDVEDDGEDEDEDEDDDEVDLGEDEIDEDDGDDEDVIEVHDVGSSSEEEVEVGGDEADEEDEDDGDGEEDEDVEDEEDDRVPRSPVMGVDGEIDGHEQGEGDDDENENGEIGEENDQEIEEDGVDIEVDGVEVEEGREFELGDGDDEDEDGAEFLVQPIGHHANENGGGELDAGDNEDDEETDEVDDGGHDQDVNGDVQNQPSTSHQNKRKKDNGNVEDDNADDFRSSKRH